ncbi:discoidin domain-containing protein [Stieleria sp. TO1_6]|uniref:DUF7133 domain-containing protein n=1 Tax=Stieleria tagensis TaxID=2956795 RepID=UPI00209ADD6E|nr:discoidin domain-containing protein [Stieleria tagensis]MCO8120122.1 discoidin domain-containing protein [Stieleria tagensis]
MKPFFFLIVGLCVPWLTASCVAQDLGEQPDDATLVKLTASSTQAGHAAYHAIDGNLDTRWCADGGDYPQSLQLEFENPTRVNKIQLVWEFTDQWMKYIVEGSLDGQAWSMLLDNSQTDRPLPESQPLPDPGEFRYIRITGLASQGGWCSIRELKLGGDSIGTLWPAESRAGSAFVALQLDPYANQGNTVPRIEPLSTDQEAQILKDVRVPDGFKATVFAAPPAVNYPVFVAASVDGTLYVSSDGNGSLGRAPGRGRVIRLRDTDHDGHADETKVFCEVDSPRGLVWDRDRLYLMHPPNLSVFIDEDGDGVADRQQTLVKNLAFGFDKRPADHTTNGVSLGADGWLYIAGGDFGFIDAEGTDGRKLTHRGGGVIRVRPDGSDLQLYSTGTRNILEVAISPEMDLFARDNTNDGGGWDVRLHHLTGMDDHGYPRLYKNFNDECIQPLADYGGGSGCGAVFIDEPGFGVWNDAPFTADWGTGSLYRHTVSPIGSTFQETAPPQSFIKMTRPTDADVDGNSRVYCASWRGATFDWNGPDVGYIVCVQPSEFRPAPLPDFASASDDQLVDLMGSPSYRRRIAAQRELMHRGESAWRQLLQQSIDSRSDQRNLLDQLQTTATDAECIAALDSGDPVVVHTAIRCLAQRAAIDPCFVALDNNTAPAKPILRALAMMHDRRVVDGLIQRLPTANPSQRRGLLAALCRLHFQEGQWKGDSWGTRPDTRGPYYQPESWSETAKIQQTLQQALQAAGPNEEADLIQLMQQNRIESDDVLDRMLRLADSDDQWLGPAVARLASMKRVPPRAIALLQQAVQKEGLDPAVLANAIVALTKVDDSGAAESMLIGLTKLHAVSNAIDTQKLARQAFVDSQQLEKFVHLFAETSAETSSQSPSAGPGLWSDAALLAIAARSNASPETRESAASAIDRGWDNPNRRMRLMLAAVTLDNHFLDDRIWTACQNSDGKVAEAATRAARQLKIQAPAVDDSPQIQSMSVEQATDSVAAATGDVTIGQRVFAKANCAACHTISKDEVQKGPFLGNIAKTYKRPELAAAVIQPSKTIAQGFATNSILTVDGTVLTGFVTSEQSDRVTLRDQTGKEFTILSDDIELRKVLPTSVMPSGLLNEFSVHEVASLLDYLQSLSP